MVELQGRGLELKEIPNGMNCNIWVFCFKRFYGFVLHFLLMMFLLIFEMKLLYWLFLRKKFPWNFVSWYLRNFFGHVSEPEFFREVYFRMIPFYVGEWKLNTFSMVTGSTFWQ